jgi:hypothetical protein
MIYLRRLSHINTLQIFAGIYRVFAGKSECGDFKFTRIACIPTIPAKIIRKFEKKMLIKSIKQADYLLLYEQNWLEEGWY